MSKSTCRFVLCIRTVALLALIACFAGCSDDVPGPNAVDPSQMIATLDQGDAIDANLEQILLANSKRQGLRHYLLPKSNELDRIPQDPQNPLTRKKIRLGQLLYHESALGVNNVRPEGHETYSCASCHFGQAGFSANLPQGMAEGGSGFGISGEGRTFMPEYSSGSEFPDCQPIRTPTSLHSAYQELMLWNGALGGVGDNLGTEEHWAVGTPLESNFLGLKGVETQAHGGLLAHRMVDVELSRINDIPRYRLMYRLAFPDDPVINRLNTALAIAAFERTLLANEAPFQRWLRGNKTAMSAEQKRGAVLFFGEAGCVTCHTGPALNTMTFHALGMNDLDGSCDMSRVNLDPFGGIVPDGVRKGRGGFTGRPQDLYKFKTPQLYNLVDSQFYGHGASFATVREVVEYLNSASPENPIVPAEQLASEFQPLGLTPAQIDDLVAFLEEALYDDRLMRYVPNRVPSGNCIPVNDPQSREDLDCKSKPRRVQTVMR